MRWKLRRPKLSASDKFLIGTVGPYFAWPFITQLGGPPPPKDMGTVILALIGLYGTFKMAEGKAGKSDDDEAK